MWPNFKVDILLAMTKILQPLSALVFHMKFNKILLASSIAIAAFSLQGCIPLVAAGAAGGAAAGTTVGSPLTIGTQVEDTTIKTKAVNVLNEFPKLVQNESNVEIVVFNRIVLVLGQVPTQKLKTDIANKIANINRVRVVYDQLKVGKPVSFTRYAKDGWITTKIKSSMIGNVNPNQFKVVTENGVVYLLGLTTPANGSIASRIASKTTGVKQVIEAYSYIKPHSKAQIDNATPERHHPATIEKK